MQADAQLIEITRRLNRGEITASEANEQTWRVISDAAAEDNVTVGPHGSFPIERRLIRWNNVRGEAPREDSAINNVRAALESGERSRASEDDIRIAFDVARRLLKT